MNHFNNPGALDMTEFFYTRSGAKVHPANVGDPTGKPYILRPRKCTRCGGAGASDRWIRTGRVCYDCNGSGTAPGGPVRERVYTAERLAKLNAMKAKRDAKRLAAAEAKAAAAKAEADARRAEFEAAYGPLLERAAPYAERSEFISDVVGKARERCTISEKAAEALARAVDRIEAEDARRAKATFVGKVGERLKSVPVTVVGCVSFPSFYSNGALYITTLRTEEGNTLVVKSTSFARSTKGDRLVISGTVKEHSRYRGEPQTRLERVKVEEEVSERSDA